VELESILPFLSELSVNNTKDWVDENRKRYENCRKTFLQLVEKVIEDLSQFDEELSGVDPKKCVFRINRDIRFSKDKTPYKTNFGALIGPQGKKTEGTGFYLHLSPGQNFGGGGIYKPTPEALAKIRQEIDYNPDGLNKILQSQDFKNTFGSIQGDQLKTAPKGYPKDHPNIDLLRFKSYYVIHQFEDGIVNDGSFYTSLIENYKKASAINGYLKTAIE
jgi:uncharacterized protein (TIGR02453 family)